ncbi:MAG: sigma-54 interaction domain-containing protein [Hylemonella sp.]
MSSNHNLPTLLWLDPLQPLASTEQELLDQAGLCLHSIRTLDDLQLALDSRQAQALAIRHDSTCDLLASAQALFKTAGASLPLICRVEPRQMNLAVQAMRQGAAYALAADDFSAANWQTAMQAASAQVKEQALKALGSLVIKPRQRANTLPSGSPETSQPQAPQRQLVYVDPISRHLLALAQRVAQANVTALIDGPTGAGKEILARVLHESSARASGPFVGLNCAALPEQLIDDMLFGHEKGAFTGAQKDMRGLFEQAQGGTLFLDEIGEMPLHLQAKLLRVLQERQLTRLGAERTVLVDVRVIAATNKDLRAAMAARQFREDLYFRISTFKLSVPPLRERPGDILPLVAAMLLQHGKEAHPLSVSAEAQARLLAHPWPGNVRELENVVQRALVLCQSDCIEPAHLMFDEVPAEPATRQLPAASPTLANHLPAQLPVHPPAHASVHPPVPLADTLPSGEPITQTALQTSHQAFTQPTPLPITLTMAPPDLAAQSPNAFAELAAQMRALPAANLHAAVKSNELQMILAAIQSTESRIEAAKKLGISPRTLRYKLAKFKAEPAAQDPAANASAITPAAAPLAFAMAG